MSVLLPWKRTTKTVDRRHGMNRTRDAATPKPPKRIKTILLGLGLAAASVTLAVMMWSNRASGLLRRAAKVWETDSLISYSGGHCVASQGSRLFFMGPSGIVAELPRTLRQAAICGDRLYALDDTGLLTCDSKGKAAFLCRSPAEERLFDCHGYGNALLMRPSGSGVYGESWLLRAVSSGGTQLWEVLLPGIPSIAASSGATLALGLRDIAAGGVMSVVRIDALSGAAAWTRPVGSGQWRSIAVGSRGDIAYATSTHVAVIEAAGTEKWRHSFEAGADVVAFTEKAVLIARTASSTHPVLTAHSQDGSVMWEAGLPSRPHGLIPGVTSIVALCQSHVIGFSVEDGNREVYLATRDLPLALVGDVLLLGKSGGAYLLRLDMNEARR